MRIDCIPALMDNQVYLLLDKKTGKTAVIDPSESKIVEDYLEENGCKLDYIINTHHHHDHVGGNVELKKKTGAIVLANQADANRIPGFDKSIKDSFFLGDSHAEIINTPGHTRNHIALFFNEKYLFCGDTLFVAGCGRVLEGTIEELYRSVNIISKLPENTLIFCGHDYSLKNLLFALSLEKDNPHIVDSIQLIKNGSELIPSTIKREKLINPFFRINHLKQVLGMHDKSELEVFKKVREMKNQF